MSASGSSISLPEALERGEEVSPTDLLAWALERFSPRVLMTTAFGLNGVALIHMAHAFDPDLPILFIDTGYHFPETIETKLRMIERYGLNLIEYTIPPTVDDDEIRSGRVSFAENPELCCAERKVEVFQRALEKLKPDALISARSQHQSETRSQLLAIELDSHPVRVNPLATWGLEQVKRYVRDHEIPYNPLFDRGYTSVGCWPCTRPTEPGEDLRAGRWGDQDKQECGIWLEDGAVVRRPPGAKLPPEPEAD
jgi:phosphoadenosine phosphosulfate reductase